MLNYFKLTPNQKIKLGYISSVFILRRIEELEKEFDNTDSIYSATGLIARINELKNLLK